MADELSTREWQIINALIDGHTTNQEIADQLQLGEATVRVYWTRIFAKLGLRNRVEVALWAWKRQSSVTEKNHDPKNPAEQYARQIRPR